MYINCQQIRKISRKWDLTEVQTFQKVLGGGGATFLNTRYNFHLTKLLIMYEIIMPYCIFNKI